MNANWQRSWPAMVLACAGVCGCDEQSTVWEGPSDTSTTGFVDTTTSTTGQCAFLPEGGGGGASMSFGEVVTPERRAVPVGCGGLLVTRDGTLAVASDPDRDRLFVATLGEGTLSLEAEVALAAGSEPGRMVEDDASQVHVVLRGSGELLTLDPGSGQVRDQRHVCDQPRGLAYEAATDVLHVACAEGRLVTVSAASGSVVRELRLDEDLRDVVVKPDGLLVSRFRSAELLDIDAAGNVVRRFRPASIQGVPSISCDAAVPTRAFDATVAWKLTSMPDGSIVMLHQRSESTPLDLESETTYGGEGDCQGIVQTVVSTVYPAGGLAVAPSLSRTTLATDMAVSPDGNSLVLTSSTTDAGARALHVVERHEIVEKSLASAFVTGSELCADGTEVVQWDQPTAVAFTPQGQILAFARQPAMLTLFLPDDMSVALARVALSTVDVSDTGYDLFHADAGRGIACASCHPEAGDDGHVWNFVGFGPRRSQHLRGGLLGTEPFHWEGDMTQFSDLMSEVMVRRMGGPDLPIAHQDALAGWIHAQPALARSDFDEQAAARGHSLFESDETKCATCHSGAQLTNNATVNVGTGLPLQVPSLIGVSFRAPFLHDGCAATLLDRFGTCGGSDAHGHTSQLSATEIGDLVEYMKSL